jgi:hypothetical protein
MRSIANIMKGIPITQRQSEANSIVGVPVMACDKGVWEYVVAKVCLPPLEHIVVVVVA